MRATVLLLSLCFLPQSLSAQQQSAAPYRNPALPIDTRVSDLLDRMTLEEKFWQLYMSPGTWTIPPTTTIQKPAK